MTTTTLSGEFVLIDDQCPGLFSESSTGDIELGGTDGDVDCDTPTSGDNTASARSAFYELNRQILRLQVDFGSNSWLMSQLEANVNIIGSCGAFWNGVSVNFYREGFPCANTGEIASVFDHEWGHGMDDNDTQGSIISSTNGGGEGIADLFASLRLNTSCVGRGFFTDGSLCGGYGDPCTPASGCTGVRDIDFANRSSGLPHDLTFVQSGVCGSTHCRGAAYAESMWDILKRDLPAFYGMDNNTALELTTRLTHRASNVVSGWYATGGTPHANCGATFGYNQVLIVDDDNGNLADGTPHMQAIASAFARHEIDCSPANGGPVVQDSGCAGTPSMAPVLTAVGIDTGTDLSWTAVPDAAMYNVYRTDSVFQCDFGKTLIGLVPGTAFQDAGLKNGREYSYVVIPKTANPSCFGPSSACANVTAGDPGGLFTLLPPTPGTAGVANDFPTTDATASGNVFHMMGNAAGSTNVTIPGCGVLSMDFGGTARRLGRAVAGAAGDATLTRLIPGSAAGTTFTIQAVDQGSCTKSNTVVNTF